MKVATKHTQTQIGDMNNCGSEATSKHVAHYQTQRCIFKATGIIDTHTHTHHTRTNTQFKLQAHNKTQT